MLKADSFANFMTQLGDPYRDKRLGAVPYVCDLDYGTLRTLYRGNDLAARIVDIHADAMVREWLDILIEDDETQAEDLEKKLTDLNAQAAFKQALRWARAYGGGLIVIGALDGADTEQLAQPLNEKNIADVAFLNVFSAHDAQVVSWYNNPYEAKFGQAKIYRLTPQTLMGTNTSVIASREPVSTAYVMLDVHESRVLRFDGELAYREQFAGNGVNTGWGDSVLTRAQPVIRDYCTSWDSAAHLMTDFAQAVFRMSGLKEAFAEDKESLISKRMLQMDMMRATLRAMIVDAGNGSSDPGETFERASTPLSGLPELMQQFTLRLASAAQLPVSLLMGQAPSGLNATGETDVRFFYDTVRANQRDQVLPQARRLVELIMKSKAGPTRGQVPANWSIAFRSLWQVTDLEKAQLKKTMAEADKTYIDAGVLHPEEVAQSRFGGDAYSTETQLDDAARAELEAQRSAAQETTSLTNQGLAAAAQPPSEEKQTQ